MVSGFEQNGHFLSLHFLLNMIHCIQNGGTMTKITIATTQTTHPNLSAPYIGDLMTQYDIALSQSTPTQDNPMPIDLTFQEFIKAFANEGQALYYIDNILAEGRIEVSEKTLPYYTWNELANPPRFIAYADHQEQTHSFEMRITGWYEDDDSSADAIITFDRSDNGLDWFFENLYHELDGIIDQSEMHWEDTPQAHRMREIGALQLQRESYRRRIDKTRIYLIDSGAEMSPAQFEQNCKDIVELLNKVKFASERIQYLLA